MQLVRRLYETFSVACMQLLCCLYATTVLLVCNLPRSGNLALAIILLTAADYSLHSGLTMEF